MAARPSTDSEETALSLTMAVVNSSPGPLLLLDGGLNIIAASASFSATFEIDAATVPGRPLSSLGGGEWDVPQLKSLLSAVASGAAKIEAYEMDLNRAGQAARRLIVHAQRLVYLDLEHLRILMAVSDVTDARANEKLKDDALRQNHVLLQEVRHRVANSLQIIASVLLQNAKRTRSNETRGHLKDAHHRVMAIATLERQLAGSGDSDVELSVTDDGVGMPTDPAQVRTGLGTSIVQALAKQLDAELEIGAAHPGTRVVVAHTSIALLHNHAPTGLDTVSPAEQASATAVS
jgi:hypothetical protein